MSGQVTYVIRVSPGGGTLSGQTLRHTGLLSGDPVPIQTSRTPTLEDEPMTTTALAPYAFSVQDRCDRCGAQAFVRAVLPVGDLMFCAHHGRAYGEALAVAALRVEDNSASINSATNPAAAY